MTTYLSPHQQQYHHHQLRSFSNKENTPSVSGSTSPSPCPSVFELTDIDAISTSLRTSLSGVTGSSNKNKKPNLGGLGLGRAPKFTYTRKHSSSSNKPYTRERISSIQRAKKNANRLPVTSSSKPLTRSKKSGLKVKPTPLKLKQPQKGNQQEETKKLGVMDRVRLDRWRKSIYRPATNDIQGHQVRVPLMLPYPKFPPISPINPDELRDIPNQYILDRLTPALPSISTITLAYRPYSTIPHPDSLVQPGSTLPLAIPEVLDGSKAQWADKARGREPDMVLGIMKKGSESEKGKMIVPVMSLVFATQCAYWPKLTTPPPSSFSSLSSSTPSSSSASGSTPRQRTVSERAVSTSLPAIIESSEDGNTDDESEEEEEEEKSDQSWTSESNLSSSSSNDDDDDEGYNNLRKAQIPLPIKDDKGFLHLPIIPLPLPSPETFGIIHRHLHHPIRPFLPDLLSLPIEKCFNRDMIIEELSEMSVQQLMNKLEILQGVWQNLCCLGIGKLSTWRQLGEAWACIVGIIAGNGILLRNTPEPQSQNETQYQQQQQQQEQPKIRTAAEEIAWNWVKKERAKIQAQNIII